VQPETPTDPPYVPIRASGWSVHRTPRWLVLTGIGLLVIAVAVALVHKPTRAEQASDLRGVLQEMTTDIESCAGGVGESLLALHEVQGGSDTGPDVSDAISVAQQGAANCSPANNEEIDDLENYQVPESLDSFQLAGVVAGLVNWAAPDAERVQTDVANVLAARSPGQKASAEAALRHALATLDAQRTAAESVLDRAIKALAVHASPPRLPG
jgi:hypothetical protein